ncbi:unnamed protein product [Citrullus colocynthis]|uniref:Uncharacterized protein n=1 Tax=Citrullus colocynthis TaxID=252529 RepID=A0ABP0YT48_9ROSI
MSAMIHSAITNTSFYQNQISNLAAVFNSLAIDHDKGEVCVLCLLSFKTIYFEVENLEADSKSTKWMQVKGGKRLSKTK